jgi:hypothetical protein
MNNEPVIWFQLSNPILNVGGGVAVGVLIGDACDGKKEKPRPLRYQFFLTVELICKVIAKPTMETSFMASAVNRFMENAHCAS